MKQESGSTGTGDSIVVLHMLNRGRGCPSPSPFPLKLETWLRMAKIEYVVDFTKPFSHKGKTPWITFKKENVADSRFCIEHLSKAMNVDLQAHLSARELALHDALVAMLEEQYYFVAVMDRYERRHIDFIRDNIFAPFPGPSFVQSFIIRRIMNKVVKQCQSQGIGRHSKEERRRLGVNILQHFNSLLDNNQYVMGDRPTIVDCVLFAFTAQAIFHASHNFEFGPALMDEPRFDNVKKHCFRIKERFWGDWDQCVCGKEEKKTN